MAATQENFLDKLKSALRLVEDLKAENELYKDNFEQISENFAQLQDNNAKLQKEFVTVCKEKDILQADIESQRELHKKKLQDKEKEVDEMRKKPPAPKDLELIKLEMQVDIERSQHAKFELLDKECAKYRSLYYKVRREWDAAQTENEIKIAELERTKSDLGRVHQDEIQNLETKLQLLQQQVDETSQVERLRATQREKTELELRLKSLLQELDEIRAVKENARLQYEQEE
ncbi:hypothetical protein HDU91_002986, partial [Kappamyces sp. JEL0680]